MRDMDIPEDNCIIVIHTLPNTPLQDVEFEIKRAFRDYDTCVGDAEPYRENGWGLESFIEYLKYRYNLKMTFSPIYPDTSLELVGT